MIKVLFFIKNNRIIGYKISGHSEFYKKRNIIKKILKIDEKDYICSAVSAVSYMNVIAFKDVLKKGFVYKEEKKGKVEFFLKDKPDKDSDIILKSFKRTLEYINKEYPDNIEILMEDKNGS